MAFKEKEELEARVKALEAERLCLKGRLEAEQQSRPQLAHTMWGAMDTLEDALQELEVGISERSHVEEDVGTSVDRALGCYLPYPYPRRGEVIWELLLEGDGPNTHRSTSPRGVQPCGLLALP